MVDRGFKKLKGKTIKDIRVDAINSVRILCSDGTVFTLDADDTHHGIGIPQLTKEPKKLTEFPKPVRAKKTVTATIPVTPKAAQVTKTAAEYCWPFPTYESMREHGKTVELPLKK